MFECWLDIFQSAEQKELSSGYIRQYLFISKLKSYYLFLKLKDTTFISFEIKPTARCLKILKPLTSWKKENETTTLMEQKTRDSTAISNAFFSYCISLLFCLFVFFGFFCCFFLNFFIFFFSFS